MLTRNVLFSVNAAAVAWLLSFICAPDSMAEVTTPCRSLNHVVFMTVDGVRWKDFFDPKNTPKIHALANQFVMFGNRDENSHFKVSNPINKSLPGYQTLFLGFDEGAKNNQWPRPQAPTFIDELASQWQKCPDFDKDSVAAFSSWQVLENALTHFKPANTSSGPNQGNLPFVLSAGAQPWTDLKHPDDGAYFSKIIRSDLPKWKLSKKDKYTWSMSLHHYLMHPSQFLYISTGDTDEWGHQNDFKKYLSALKDSDDRVDEMMQEIAKSPYATSTTFVLTTDHGRGNKGDFKNHGPDIKHSDEAFLIVSTPEIRKQASANKPPLAISGEFEHRQLRPIFEYLLEIQSLGASHDSHLLDTLRGAHLL